MRATPSSQLQSTPANLSSPLPAKTRASGSWSVARMCTPKRSPSTSALWQRELWSTDTSTDGGLALNDETDVATSPHGSPSSRCAVTTATPEQSAAMASRKSCSTSATKTETTNYELLTTNYALRTTNWARASARPARRALAGPELLHHALR